MNPVFPERMRELRNQKKMSQKDLGKLLGLSGKTISAYEKGRNAPGLDTLVAASRALGVSVDYLVGTADENAGEDRTDYLSLDGIPVFGSGEPGTPCEHIAFRSANGYMYGVVVGDDSAEPVLSKGDVALVRSLPALEGDLVVWKAEGLILRRLYFQEDSIILKPENSKYRSIVLGTSEIAASLLGVVAGRWQRLGRFRNP